MLRTPSKGNVRRTRFVDVSPRAENMDPNVSPSPGKTRRGILVNKERYVSPRPSRSRMVQMPGSSFEQTYGVGSKCQVSPIMSCLAKNTQKKERPEVKKSECENMAMMVLEVLLFGTSVVGIVLCLL